MTSSVLSCPKVWPLVGVLPLDFPHTHEKRLFEGRVAQELKEAGDDSREGGEEACD